MVSHTCTHCGPICFSFVEVEAVEKTSVQVGVATRGSRCLGRLASYCCFWHIFTFSQPSTKYLDQNLMLALTELQEFDDMRQGKEVLTNICGKALYCCRNGTQVYNFLRTNSDQCQISLCSINASTCKHFPCVPKIPACLYYSTMHSPRC